MDIYAFLIKKAEEYDRTFFIKDDPVCIPHLFSKNQDIEIAGFFAAIFAWGQRTTIISKSRELLQLMDDAPHDFCLHHSDSDLKKLLHFKHRTFNTTDLLYFISFFKYHFSHHKSLESAFTDHLPKNELNVEKGLNWFYNYFFSLEDVPTRTLKHIACPAKKSACKRINMFLRWMVRRNSEVDFGIWKKISPAQLVIPLDLHVARVARHFNLLSRTASDWEAAVELTNAMRTIDPKDPVKFDYALFALGVLEKY